MYNLGISCVRGKTSWKHTYTDVLTNTAGLLPDDIVSFKSGIEMNANMFLNSEKERFRQEINDRAIVVLEATIRRIAIGPEQLILNLHKNNFQFDPVLFLHREQTSTYDMSGNHYPNGFDEVYKRAEFLGIPRVVLEAGDEVACIKDGFRKALADLERLKKSA